MPAAKSKTSKVTKAGKPLAKAATKRTSRTGTVRTPVIVAPLDTKKAGKTRLSKPDPKSDRRATRRDFYRSVVEVLQAARQRAYRAINFTIVDAYWQVGRMIVEEEMQGKDRADYGAYLIHNLSIRLMEEFGKGFDESNLRNIRQFFLAFPIRDALRHELTWTHYRLISRVEDEKARAWYLNETARENWSTRVLERQIGTSTTSACS